MAEFVIDASISAAWFLPDEQNSTADNILSRLAEDNAFVPVLWHFEIRNLIIMAERRGRLTAAMAAASLASIEACPVTTDSGANLNECMRLARTFQLTFYDALYLELSIRRNIRIATLDKALIRCASQQNLLFNLT